MNAPYLDSIKRYLPDWNIRIWRDDDIIINNCEYYSKMLSDKRYAYASDYLRFKILYEEGGIYVDTDVEFVRPIDDLIECGEFYATEQKTDRVTSGLIMFCPNTKSPIMKSVMEYYEKLDGSKYVPDGEVLAETLKEYKYMPLDENQILSNGIHIYDSTYFCQNDNDNARAIHHYFNSWMDGVTYTIRQRRKY